jgi:hypothetical protein
MLTFLITHNLTLRGTSSRVCMPNFEVFGLIMKEELGNTQNAPKVKLIYRLSKKAFLNKTEICLFSPYPRVTVSSITQYYMSEFQATLMHLFIILHSAVDMVHFSKIFFSKNSKNLSHFSKNSKKIRKKFTLQINEFQLINFT